MYYYRPELVDRKFDEPSSSSEFLSDYDESEEPLEKMTQAEIKKASEEAEITDPPESAPIAEDTRKPKTLCELALTEIDDEEFEQFLDFQHKPTESTVRKEAWALRLYSAFCKKGKVSHLFPLSGSVACGFLSFLAIRCGYALNGIEQVILPALRRLQIRETGSEDKQVVLLMKQTIRNLRRHPKVKLHGTGHQPLCSFDVAEMVQRIPDTLDTKLQDVSLFLFALHTGARAMTCEAVRWADIVRVDGTDPAGVWRVIVILRVTKGNPHWDHPVCIEGYPETRHPLDVVYWLNQYAKKLWNQGLFEITKRETGQNGFDETSVWGLSREAMRARVERRLEQCGFPKGKWSFHSFRSGHICSALLAAGADTGKRACVLEVTAVVAGWHPKGRAQKGYLKKVAEKQIVCSRLLGLGIGVTLHTPDPKEPDNQTDIQNQSASPLIYTPLVAAEGYVHTPKNTEEFHFITLSKPNWSVRLFLNAVRKKFNDAFPTEGCRKAIVRHRINCFNSVLVAWARESRGKEQHDYKTSLRIGRTILLKKVRDGEDPVSLGQSIINKVYELQLDPQVVPNVLHYNIKHPADSIPINRSTVVGRTGKLSRHRIPWTDEEDSLLIETRKQGKLFADIRPLLFRYGRSSEDACQRWKVLVRKQPDLLQFTAKRKHKQET